MDGIEGPGSQIGSTGSQPDDLLCLVQRVLVERNPLGWIHGIFVVLSGLLGGAVYAQVVVPPQPSEKAPLVFRGVTVVDVRDGQRLADQTVVIVGNRIQAITSTGQAQLPPGGQVVEAQGKYLIPGLWDMHTHPMRYTDYFYPLFLANGVTGIRDAGSEVPIDTLRRLRQEILAGARVGPPRQILSGGSINERASFWGSSCRSGPMQGSPMAPCLVDSAGAVRLVDSLKAAGVDMIKIREVGGSTYFTLVAAARRLGIPFGGHGSDETVIEASDSGASIIDHVLGGLATRCIWNSENVPVGVQMQDMLVDSTSRTYDASVEQCRSIAERFIRNGTWWVPTLIASSSDEPEYHTGGPRSQAVFVRFKEYAHAFRSGSVLNPYSSDSTGGTPYDVTPPPASDQPGFLYIVQDAGVPILAGTDIAELEGVEEELIAPGISLHAELAMYVAEGLAPLNALQSATLNPAKFLRGTDSLGTVAVGKLADLVLLDADPLVNITNTTKIRAVVANGYYYDRTALDQLLVEIQARIKKRVP